METMQSTHPSPRQLAALALGRLKPDARDRLQAHVATCASCETFLAQTPPETLNSSAPAKCSAAKHGRSADIVVPAGTRHQSGHGHVASSQSAFGGRIHLGGFRLRRTLRRRLIPRELRQQTKYRIVRLSGRGGMGSVYEAHHERMDRRQALKVINPELVDNPQALSRFEEEVKAVAKLDHPNIARAYDAESFGPLQAIVMEFVAGTDVARVPEEAGPACRHGGLPLRPAGVSGASACARAGTRASRPQAAKPDADAGHRHHQDIGLRPGQGGQREQGCRGLTKTNMTMGTYEYSAPEQALDAARADIRADIYSLGCTIYYLIAGVLPFACNSDAKLLSGAPERDAASAFEVCPETPQEFRICRPDAREKARRTGRKRRPKSPRPCCRSPRVRSRPARSKPRPNLRQGPAQCPSFWPEGEATGSPRPLAGKGQGVRARRAGLLATLPIAAIPPRFRTRGWFVAAGGPLWRVSCCSAC